MSNKRSFSPSSGSEKLSEKWRQRVEDEVTKIKNDEEIKVRNDITAAWRSNRRAIKERHLKISEKPQVVLDAIPSVVIVNSGSSDGDSINDVTSKKRKFAKVTSDKTKKSQHSEIMTISHVDTQPHMNTWAPIRRNVLTEDDNYHSNIPYFGDEQIGSNFIKSFEETVKNENKIFEDDTLFLSLVNNLARVDINDVEEENDSKLQVLENPSSHDQRNWHFVSSCDRSLPGLIVFQAISDKFPDYGSVEDLIKKFKKLNDMKTTTNLVQDIDGPYVEAISADRATHSYRSLLCRRCFKYDCPLHNDEFVDAPPKVDKEEATQPTSPCGPDCFLNLASVRGVMSPLTPVSLNRANKTNSGYKYDPGLAKAVGKKLLGEYYTEENLENWNNSEITLFRMLASIFSTNWCAIGQGMMTKTCAQVYEFSKQELGNVAKIKKRSNGLSRRNKIKKKNTKAKAKQAALYKGNSKDGERENSNPYTPCYHPGQPCNDEHCSCKQKGNFCEKFCYCPVDCIQRFPGCKCKSKCATNACACFLACRECDPDLCNTCLDGNLEFNPETNSCRNVMIQRELGKKLYVAPSDIAGWGCFIGEKANKNEFIAEYLGEIISQEESERRGKIYDKAKCSYMFNLNEEFCVDAARMGGKIRFANHSSKPNCSVKILMVNGDHRIGIYANKPIEEGEELFFDYGKDFHGHDII